MPLYGFWFMYIPLIRMVKFQFLAQFLRACLSHPVVSCLILLFCLVYALAYYGIVFSSLSPHNQHLCLNYFRSNIVGLYGVVLCYYQKRFTFSLEVFLSLICPWLLAWDFTCLSLWIAEQTFFFSFQFLLVVVLLLIFVLFPVAVISLSLLLFM